MTGNDRCVIRGSKEMTIFLNNSLFKNEMLQKTAEMYEQDKKELRYEVRNFIFYCENHMTNVKTCPFHFPISQWKRSKHWGLTELVLVFFLSFEPISFKTSRYRNYPHNMRILVPIQRFPEKLFTGGPRSPSVKPSIRLSCLCFAWLKPSLIIGNISAKYFPILFEEAQLEPAWLRRVEFLCSICTGQYQFFRLSQTWKNGRYSIISISDPESSLEATLSWSWGLRNP